MMSKWVHVLGVILLLAIVVLVLGGWIKNYAVGGGDDLEFRRTFVIRLPDHLRAEKERVPVEFGHELHTAALGDDSCGRCHQRDSVKGFDFRFVHLPADAPLEDHADAYHDGCMSCHEEEGRGPRACAECHFKVKPYRNAVWHVRDLDLREHQKHVDAMEGNCGACHHVYDETSGRLVIEAGSERSCRDCHRETAVGDRLSMREAAHAQCLTCHMQRENQGVATGPIACAGCHDDPGFLPAVTDMSDVKRLERGQPDTPVITIDGLKMKSVPFNHRGHEAVTRNCRTCHHESLEKCSNCHTLSGSERGGHVKLADAYHRRTASQSCVGCHEEQKKDKTCAVCHGVMPPGPRESSCDVCHSGPLPGGATVRKLTDPASLLPPDLPKVLKISAIADEYEPVDLPHLDVVRSLNRLIGDQKLANVFHGTTAVVCAACHHHSPLGASPPTCARCHQDAFDPHDLHRPGLKGAYHRQCIGCHKDMELIFEGRDYRDCRVCHRDAKPMPGHVKGEGR